MSELETREFEIRSVEDDGTFEAYGVRYGEVADIGGRYKETFQRGAFEGSTDIKVYRDHREIIGHVIETEDREEGYWFRAKVALTSLGKDTLALLRSGALSKVSVGFVPLDQRDDNGVVVRTKAALREISVVERPAYAGASVLAVREESTNEVREDQNQEEPVSDTVSTADLEEVRGTVEDLERRFSVISVRDEEPAVDTRSAGAFLKALASGDEATTHRYEQIQEEAREDRAYTGATTADAPVKDAWVGDLTRIYDASSGVLSAIFATGTLPAEGNNIEFAELNTNTVQVTEQANEGDDLAYGKVTLRTRTAPVKTYGGYVQLSRQTIERSTLPVLNRSLEALAVAAGQRAKAELRSDFNALVSARRAISSDKGVVALGKTLAAGGYVDWVSALVDGAGMFEDNALNIDALIVSKSVFKTFAGLTGADGRPLVSLDGSGANTVGRLNVTALNGTLAGLPFVLDSGLTGDVAVLANSRAIRVYKSGLVSLQDENIINLSKDFSVYQYAAIADEIPAGIVPVKFATS